VPFLHGATPLQDSRVGPGRDPHAGLRRAADQPRRRARVLAVGHRQQGPSRRAARRSPPSARCMEETGIDAAAPRWAAASTGGCENVYEIYPRWRAPLRARRDAQHRARVRPVRARGTPVTLARASTPPSSGCRLARGGRRLLLPIQRRSHPVAARICDEPADDVDSGRDLQHPQGRAGVRARRGGWRSTTSAMPSNSSMPTSSACRRCASCTGREEQRTSPAGPSCRRPNSSAPRATPPSTRPTPSRATASTAMRCCRAGRWCRTGHEDMSDHRFEQRGLLHVEVEVGRRAGACHRAAPGADRKGSRVRQIASACASSSTARCRPTRRGGRGRLQRLGRHCSEKGRALQP
jgi:hypothetical protein